MMLSNTDRGLRRFWHPVAREIDLPADAPLGVRLLGERWALARLGGEVVALRDLCPHRFVPLSAGTIVEGELQCAYHGYRFGPSGRVTAIPALPPELPIPPKACVDTARVAVRFGVVWLAVEEPIDDLLDDAGYRDPANDLFVAGPFTTRVSAGILADNFLDAAHFPFLHRDTFATASDTRPRLTVHRDGWRIHQTDVQIVDGAHLDQPEESVAVYEVAAPFSVELRLDRPGGSDFIWSFACPVDDTTTVWWMVHAYPLGGDAASIDAACELQTRVGVEDLWMLEQMDDPRLPLDVRAEVHTRADLGCLEYRRMLADVVRAPSSAAPAPLDPHPRPRPVAAR